MLLMKMLVYVVGGNLHIYLYIYILLLYLFDVDILLLIIRTMREVQDIMGTQDGVHVMVLCTDGGIMHYKRPHSYPEHIKTSGLL